MNTLQTLVQLIDSHELWEDNVTLQRNEYLKTAGSIDTNLYFVKNGSLRIFIIDEEEEHTIRFGYKNNIIAALDSFIHGKKSDFYIQALKKSDLKVVKRSSFMNLMKANQQNNELWIEILKIFVLQQMDREHDILISSPVERYQRVLQRSPQLFQEIPNKYIASYLRMTPETLSRIKKS